MIFHKLTFFNFKSFAGHHIFEFDAQGLFFLTGKNLLEPALEGNGVGKTSLLDALYWCLYGKTLRNLRAANVHTWGEAGETAVSLDFSLNDIAHSLKRTWRPNSLNLDGQDVTQDQLENLIGLTADAFQHTILIGQFSQMFFDLRPAEKLNLFTSILDLDYWLECSAKSNADVNKHEKQKQALLQEQSSVTGSISALEGYIKYQQELSKSFEQKRQQDLINLKKDFNGLEINHRELLTKQKTFRKNAEGFNNDIKSLTDEYEEVDKERIEIDKYTQNHETRLRENIAKRSIIQKEVNKFNGVKDICPYCKQKVTAEHLKQEKIKLQIEIDRINSSNNRIDTKLIELHNAQNETTDDLNSINGELAVLIRKQQKYTAAITEIKSALSRVDLRISHCKRDLAEVKTRKNTHEQQIKDLNDNIDELNGKMGKLQSQIENTNRKLEAAKYWVKGFKDIRLHIVDEVLTSLEVEVNNNIQQLGLDDWVIKFDIEKETKTGGITKGFTVSVFNPYTQDVVPLEAYSGGEGQRLKLAGTLGLANTVLTANGIDTNILILDEPTQHLSKQGADDLIHLLEFYSKVQNKAIYFVDHNSINHGAFDDTITVIKDKNGSRIT